MEIDVVHKERGTRTRDSTLFKDDQNCGIFQTINSFFTVYII